MNKEKIVPLLKGTIKHFPGVKTILPKKTGGTIESRYCYSVWMKHMKHWAKVKNKIPDIVAELGPGDSLGIGLSALLSGCSKLYALDVVKYWENQRNLQIFEELIELFKSKSNIPDNREYPKVHPEIDNYNFPIDTISEAQLNESLSEDRLAMIKNELNNINNPNNSFITVQIPWNDSNIIKRNSVDFIYSQAVLEHIEDLENTYNAMREWLKPSGLMSHTIDFKSHEITKSWNGHWTFSDFEWEIVKGGKKFLINRQPYSDHIELHSKYGFEILEKSIVKLKNSLTKEQLSKRFKTLTDEELTTSGMYILSKKK
jgi:hypothetical protein